MVLDGRLVLSGAFGLSDLAAQTPASARTIFRIASMTKSFTALAILKLRDQGRLSLDDPIRRFIPEFKRMKPLTHDAPAITIRHLLTHGAGFPEDNPWGDRQLNDSEHDLSQLLAQGLFFSNPPGSAFEYSNLGYALLGRVVARVSGISCQTYIDRHILRPLQMEQSAWDFRKVPSALLARGYRWEEERWKEEAPLEDGSYAAMGGMLSSVEDFARYLALHQEAWPPREDNENGWIRRATLREMHFPWRLSQWSPQATPASGVLCPTMSAYGYGLAWTLDCHQRVRVSHSGGLPGYGSQWVFFPDYGFGLIGLANRTYAGWSAAHRTVFELLLGPGGLEPRSRPVSPILNSRRESLIQLLPAWKGAETSAVFAENFFQDNPVHLLRKTSQDLFARAGRILRTTPIKPDNQLRGTFAFEGEQGSVEAFFTLTPENPPLIQELKLKFVPRP